MTANEFVEKYIGQSDYFGVKEVAYGLSKNDRTIRRYIESGKLDAMKFGWYRISKDSLIKFVENSTIY